MNGLRKERPRKWEVVVELVECGRLNKDYTFIEEARRWAILWGRRGRLQTSLSLAVWRILTKISEDMRLRRNMEGVDGRCHVLYELLQRQARLSRVQTLQAKTRAKFRRTASDREIEAEIRRASVPIILEVLSDLAYGFRRRR